MKRASLVVFCLLIAARLCAQTIINVTLTRGNVTTGPGSYLGDEPISSFLTAPGYTITNVSGNDPASTGIGNLCNGSTGGCTPAQIASNMKGMILAFPPNGSMVVNGQLFGMWGFPGFVATTFSSSLGANGVLTVYGIAAGYSTFNECDVQTECGYLPVEVNFGIGTPWTYIGQFVPDSSTQGAYDLQSMVLSSGPVPLINPPLTPSSIAPGESGFTLTVNGAGFTPTSVVNWNGSGRPTSFVSSTQLTVTVAASDVATPQTVQVTVVNQSIGISSNTSLLEVTSATSSVSMNQTFSYLDSDYHRWMAVGDFNGDGKSDIVVTDTNSRNVSVFQSNGDGTFRPPVNSNTNLNVESVTVGDFNGDGKLDIAVSDDVSVVEVLLGNGDGSFQAPLVIPETFPAALSVAVGDFNADGALDLAVANQTSNSVSVLLGNGDGTFQTASTYPTGKVPVSVAVGDFNGDGVLDLVTANRTSNTISILLGGTLQNQKEYAAGTSPISVIVADVNADGKPDVVVANQNSTTVSVFLGNGDGTFQPKVDYATNTTYSYALLSGDFNGDGKLDLVTVGDSNVSILFGDGDGSFKTPITIALGPGFAEGAADFNDDGRLDLATSYAGSVAVLSQAPNGKVSPTALNFGPVLVGQISPKRLVALSNIGSSELTVSNISISGDFAFSNNSCTKGVKPETHCNVDVTFTPTALGPETGTITFTDNSPNSPQTVSLSGTGSNTATTATTLTSGLNPSTYGQAVIFTATVSSSIGSPPDGEIVTFKQGATVLGTGTLSSGTANLSYSMLGAGTKVITAVYGGDSKFNGSSSKAVEQVVAKAASTTALVSSSNPSVQGRSVTFTASVPSVAGTPTGTIQYFNGTAALGVATLASGSAKYTTSKLPAGSNSITAVYYGDSNYNGSTSAPVIQFVIAATVTTLKSSPNPSPYGQAVIFAATVSSTIGSPPDGEIVTFKQGTTVLGTGTLSGSTATLSSSKLGVGTKAVTATYAGDAKFAASTSKSVSQVIRKASTATALSSSANPSSYKQSVTFTATVTPQFRGTVTGSVTFTDGTTTLRTTSLSGGSAKYTTTTLVTGTHNITATYNGSASFVGSSAGLMQTVN
jgi:hypothetical protein